jgi:hypothetical protein
VKLALDNLDEAQRSMELKPNSKVFERDRFGALSKALDLCSVPPERSPELRNNALMN